MNLIKNLKIRDKLLLLLILLLIPLMYFVAASTREELEESRKLKLEAVQLEESEKVSDFIHAFQQEQARMLAATAGDPAFLWQAKAQRGRTDATAKALNDFVVNSGRHIPELAMLNELEQYRQDLDAGKLNVFKFRDYSTELIFNLIDRIEVNATGIGDVEIARQLSSFRSLAEAKVQLGRIRSQMMKAIPEGIFSYEDYGHFKSQKDFYREALKDFYKRADKESVREVEQLTATDNYKKLASLFRTLEENPELHLAALDPITTFNEFATTIEHYRIAESELINRIRNRVQEASRQKEQYMMLLIGSFILLFVVVGILSIYIINLISSSLSALKRAADRIKVGATDVKIDVDSQDEIGSLADSFKGVLQKNVALSRVAQAIGEGRYDVEVEVQSNEDVLSHAIRDMKSNLQAFTTENADRSWILTGVSELNNLIAGETALESLSEKAISYLCGYTGSKAGILYLSSDKGDLEPIAGCGEQFSQLQLATVGKGTGNVGQAVSDKQIKVVEGVPEPNIQKIAGLSETEAASCIIIPLLFSATVVGALELCAQKSYSSLQQKFLDTASERLSVVVHTLKSHLQTQELLYETQNQAEELETRQEELRQLNAELKVSEEELRVNQEELQEKNTELEEKTQLLEEQYEALQQKNEALEDAREAIELKIQQVETVSKYKSDFMANMSHELRTPLNSILILSRLLTDNPEKSLTAKQVDHAQIIHKSGNDLLRLINEILDLSKIESGKIRLENQEVKLEDIKLEPLFGEVASKKNIRYTERYTPGAFDTIVTDRFRLEQILKNFIGNAIKFTGAGGEVELSVYPVLQKPELHSEQLREQPELVAFSVRDTGIGIPKDKQEMVFEAFQQADSSTTRKYGGTGLGLTISQELATLLSGELTLESEPGKGSTFTLYLPRVPSTETRKAPAAVAPVSPQARTASGSQVVDKIQPKNKKVTTVLIIEDDKGFNDILADFANAKSFKVHQAYTGQEGLRLARQEKPDAILLDVQLPDISGWEVLRQMREDEELRQINIYVMSAYDKEAAENPAGNEEEYLPKPVTLETLNKAFTAITEKTTAAIKTILIVEDAEAENRAVAELLLAHGYKTVSALSAGEAEQALARQKADCIILDLKLPGIKGYEWIKKIRSGKDLSRIPIIIYSGKDLSHEEEAKLEELGNTVIIKNEHSYLRLLDEVQLFLHKVNQKLPEGNDFKMKLHVPEEILRSKKVLLVDDDVRNIYSLSSLLELQGMEVIAAYDGKEALERLQATPGIDIVLMDVMTPGMDGIETIKRIREISRFKQLPIIALTAKAMKEDREKCMEAGATDFMPKPVDTDKLLTLMRVWLYDA